MNQRIQLSDHFTTSRILRFAASPIIMMVFTSIYSVVDGFFVSNFAGKQAFAAVNLIMPFLQAFGCIGFMLGTGGSALVAMTLGTGNKKRANELFSMLVCATAVLGVIFTVVALLVLRPAAVLLGAIAELLDDCILYGTIITVFQTAFMLQFLFQSFFITAEKPKLGLFFTVAAGLTNMVLDFVFVGVMGLGITGAAAATVISQLIGGIGPMFYFARPGNGSLLHFVRPVFSGKALLKACTNGSSELMTNLSASLVGALYNWQLLRLGGGEGGGLVALGLDVPEIVDVRLRQAPVRGLVKSIAGPDKAPVRDQLIQSPCDGALHPLLPVAGHHLSPDKEVGAPHREQGEGQQDEDGPPQQLLGAQPAYQRDAIHIPSLSFSTVFYHASRSQTSRTTNRVSTTKNMGRITFAPPFRASPAPT